MTLPRAVLGTAGASLRTVPPHGDWVLLSGNRWVRPETVSREPVPLVPPSAALRALLAAVSRVVPLKERDARRYYFAVGGRFCGVPTVLHELSVSSWTGLSWQDLCSHRPFVDVAGAMYRQA